MCPLQPGRHASTWVPARIHYMPAVMIFRLIQQGLNPRLRKAPRARIQRLFLRPDDRLGVGVMVQVFPQLGPGEGIELLDAGDGDGVEFLVRAVLL